MTSLIAAAVLFIAIHLLVSGTRLRDTLVSALGEKVYMALFSIASLALIVWLVMSYNDAVTSAENVIYWQAPAGLMHSGGILILIAAFFAVAGITTPGPTSAGGDAALAQSDDPAHLVKGIHALTRHPFLWGAVIWSAFHMGVNGDRASQIFFGTFLLVSFLGTFSIDAKRKRVLGDKWTAYAGASSNVPFLALVRGRARLSLSELGWWRIAAALVVWGALFASHEWLFGVSPVPGA
ncbi:MAG: NnrU family protein [Parvibaculaceae bacterium]